MRSMGNKIGLLVCLAFLCASSLFTKGATERYESRIKLVEPSALPAEEVYAAIPKASVQTVAPPAEELYPPTAPVQPMVQQLPQVAPTSSAVPFVPVDAPITQETVVQRQKAFDIS